MVKEIKQYQKKFLQHVQRMDTNRVPKQALQHKPKGRRNIGRPRKRWRDQLHLEDQGTGNTPNPSGTWWWWWRYWSALDENCVLHCVEACIWIHYGIDSSIFAPLFVTTRPNVTESALCLTLSSWRKGQPPVNYTFCCDQDCLTCVVFTKQVCHCTTTDCWQSPPCCCLCRPFIAREMRLVSCIADIRILTSLAPFGLLAFMVLYNSATSAHNHTLFRWFRTGLTLTRLISDWLIEHAS